MQINTPQVKWSGCTTIHITFRNFLTWSDNFPFFTTTSKQLIDGLFHGGLGLHLWYHLRPQSKLTSIKHAVCILAVIWPSKSACVWKLISKILWLVRTRGVLTQCRANMTMLSAGSAAVGVVPSQRRERQLKSQKKFSKNQVHQYGQLNICYTFYF